jgi:small subunit ribosomal protein S18
MAGNYKNNSSRGKSNDSDDGFLKISLVNQGVFVKKKKVCPLKQVPMVDIDYKNLNLLNKFLTERGKIISSRINNVSLKKQRAVASAIKTARQVALLSPISKEVG